MSESNDDSGTPCLMAIPATFLATIILGGVSLFQCSLSEDYVTQIFSVELHYVWLYNYVYYVVCK